MSTLLIPVYPIFNQFIRGVDISHPEFEGRASFGASFVGRDKKKRMRDDNGHGTHVAGLVGSKTFGVAKKAHIIAVKCLDGDGSGTSFMIGQAIRFVIREVKKSGRTSIINMSLGTDNDLYIDLLSEKAVNAGIHVVAAAGNLIVFLFTIGNENKDSCESSPANVESVISVGATDKFDRKAHFSNYGKCVNVFAPGTEMFSTYKDGKTKILDGTSMSSPLVAGALAVTLSENKFYSLAEAQKFFIASLSRNKLRGIRDSPNIMLFSNEDSSFEAEYPEATIQSNKSKRSNPLRPLIRAAKYIAVGTFNNSLNIVKGTGHVIREVASSIRHTSRLSCDIKEVAKFIITYNIHVFLSDRAGENIGHVIEQQLPVHLKPCATHVTAFMKDALARQVLHLVTHSTGMGIHAVPREIRNADGINERDEAYMNGEEN